MDFPQINECIRAVRSPEAFRTLTAFEATLRPDGDPLFIFGNFANVFKMRDADTDAFYAFCCITVLPKYSVIKKGMPLKTATDFVGRM